MSNEGCHKGLVYCQYVVWEKQSTYRVSSLGPVQEDPGWRAWCRCCPRPPQSSGPGSRVVGLPATICEQTEIAQRPNTKIGQWAMCCKTTINSFLLYNYEQYGGLGRLNTSCTNTHSNRFSLYGEWVHTAISLVSFRYPWHWRLGKWYLAWILAYGCL